MRNKELLAQVKELNKPHLTGDMSQSVDYVYHNLKENHVAAALWLNEQKAMTLNAYNFHDLILNYESLKLLALASGGPEVLDLTEIEGGAFNPAHLVEYFQQL